MTTQERNIFVDLDRLNKKYHCMKQKVTSDLGEIRNLINLRAEKKDQVTLEEAKEAC